MRFEQLNPFTVAVYYLCVLGIIMFSMNPLLLCVALLTSILSAVIGGTADKRAHIFSLAVFLIAALLNPIFVHKGATPLFFLNDNPITLEATVYGLCAAGMLTAALYRLRDLSKVMTSDRVLYLFGRFSPQIALLLSMAIRYTALLRVRWRKIRDSQRALGLFDDGNLIDAGLLDLGIAGVSNTDITDPLVLRAVTTYVRVNFGSPDDYDRLKASYDEQKAQLGTATGYTTWEVSNGSE